MNAFHNYKSNQHFVNATTVRYLTFSLHCSPLLYLRWFDSKLLLQFKFNISIWIVHDISANVWCPSKGMSCASIDRWHHNLWCHRLKQFKSLGFLLQQCFWKIIPITNHSSMVCRKLTFWIESWKAICLIIAKHFGNKIALDFSRLYSLSS